MPPSIPTSLYPVVDSSLLVGKEATADVAPTAFTGIPVGPLQVDNKVHPLFDDNLRNSQVTDYDLQLGPRWAEITIPESPCYGDTIGHALLGLLGDLTSTGTASTPTWTTSASISPGDSAITVTSGSSAVAGTYIQIDTGTNAEIVKVGSGSTGTSVTVDATTPIRFSHLSGITLTTVVAPFTHIFSLLNMGSSTGSTSAQPPTYTLLHRNGIPGTGNFSADMYGYGHFQELKFQAKKDGWFVWDGKVMSYSRTYPSADYPPSFSSVRGIPTWTSTVTLAGGAVYNISDLSVTLTRKLDPVSTADGVQDYYVIGAGPVSTAWTVDYDVVANETPLDYLLNNTEPTFTWTVSNGLSGANLVSFTMDAELMAHTDVPLAAMDTFWGYKAQGRFMASTAMAGNSGGYSPCKVTIINAVPYY